MISVLMIENKGFEILFQDGKARLKPRGSSSTGIILGVREHGLYRLTSKPMDHGKKKQVEQVQASEGQVQVPEKKVEVPKAQRESSSSRSLQVQRETV